jgi:hypothetical protein
MLTQTVQSVDYADYANLSATQKQKALNALNFTLDVYGYVLATEIVAVQYSTESNLWQFKYANEDDLILVYTWYDCEFVNALEQSPEPQEVFEPQQEILNVVSALREEFSGVNVKVKNRLVTVTFNSLTLKFLCTTENKLQFLGRYWNNFSCEVGTYYTNRFQLRSLLAQLRSDLWFELEVMGVA